MAMASPVQDEFMSCVICGRSNTTLELKHRESVHENSFVSFFVYGCYMALAWMRDSKSARTVQAKLFCPCVRVCVYALMAAIVKKIRKIEEEKDWYVE